MWDHFRSAPFLLNGAFCQIGCPHILPMAYRDLEMIEASLAILHQTGAGFGIKVLVWPKESVVTVLSLLTCRRLAHISDQRFEPGLNRAT